nr:MAG TPA: hypothetical protein [Caudoviricetes sp.]
MRYSPSNHIPTVHFLITILLLHIHRISSQSS